MGAARARRRWELAAGRGQRGRRCGGRRRRCAASRTASATAYRRPPAATAYCRPRSGPLVAERWKRSKSPRIARRLSSPTTRPRIEIAAVSVRRVLARVGAITDHGRGRNRPAPWWPSRRPPRSSASRPRSPPTAGALGSASPSVMGRPPAPLQVGPAGAAAAGLPSAGRRCGWAGWPRGVTPPGLPQIRTCGFPASGSSAQRFATRMRAWQGVAAAAGGGAETDGTSPTISFPSTTADSASTARPA